MIILTELDKNGHPVMLDGVPLAISTCNDYYDREPGASLAFLVARMKVLSAEQPLERFAIGRQVIQIIMRDREEPLNPCGT